eukprot:15452080-Alexandrium_andersonii.AAC.2
MHAHVLQHRTDAPMRTWQLSEGECDKERARSHAPTATEPLPACDCVCVHVCVRGHPMVDPSTHEGGHINMHRQAQTHECM